MTYTEFITNFQKIQKTTKGVLVKCPSHDDGRPSLSISEARDGGVLLKCFAGCTSEQIVKSLGLSLKDLFASEKAVHFTPPVATSNGVHLPEAKPVIEKIYSYENEDGFEVYQVLRMRPKTFRQRHFKDGKWIYSMDGVSRVLYRLPQIIAAQAVVVCEGEKDADNLGRLGFVATCNVGGAGKWLDAYTESLKDKELILCGDNDEAGRKHMELVYKSVCMTAKSVKVLKLPQTVKDASDYIQTFKNEEEAKGAFSRLVSDAYPHVKGEELPIYSIAELEDSYRNFVKHMDDTAFSLSHWLPSLSCLRPLVPGELVVIIGDTGVGKTSVAQTISRVTAPLTTIFFELELPKELIFERYVSMITGWTGSQVEAGYRQANGDSLRENLEQKYPHLFICPKARLDLNQIEKFIIKSELKSGSKARVVVVDYLQLLMGPGNDRREKVSDIIEGFKVMAKSLGIIIIVSSQISRPPHLKEGQVWIPTLHSAKESGSIEASCGLMLSVWRREDGALMVKVLKSTKGGAGKEIVCNFDGARTKITERISPLQQSCLSNPND